MMSLHSGVAASLRAGTSMHGTRSLEETSDSGIHAEVAQLDRIVYACGIWPQCKGSELPKPSEPANMAFMPNEQPSMTMVP